MSTHRCHASAPAARKGHSTVPHICLTLADVGGQLLRRITAGFWQKCVYTRTTLTFAVLIAALSLSTFATTPQDLLVNGRNDQAIAALKARTTANVNDAEAWNLLGRAYYQSERWDEAIDALQRAVDLRPNDSSFHLWLGRSYGEKADDVSFVTAVSLAKKVRAEFERAVELNPNNVEARSDLAEFYVSAPGFLGGGRDKALVQADAVTQSAPGTAHWIRAMVADNAKDHSTAENELKTAVQQAKDPARAWLSLAYFYRRRNRGADAEAAVVKAVNGTKTRDGVIADAAEVLYRSGRNFDYAITLLREYVNGSTHSEDAPVFHAHYVMGQIFEKQGNRTAAAEQYRAAVSLASLYKPAQQALRKVQ